VGSSQLTVVVLADDPKQNGLFEDATTPWVAPDVRTRRRIRRRIYRLDAGPKPLRQNRPICQVPARNMHVKSRRRRDDSYPFLGYPEPWPSHHPAAAVIF
jgi:hypothetical protein